MKAMVFAAGLGSRLREETRLIPKPLVNIGGKPLLLRAIEKLTLEGITEIVVNVHHYSNDVISWIRNKNFDVPVFISDESAQLLDTGGGLKKASSWLKGEESVLLYNVDILSSLNLHDVVNDHLRSGALVSLVVRKRQTQRYFLFNHQMQLVGWINKKSGKTVIARPEDFFQPEEYAFSGIHVISPEIFDMMPEENRFSITDWYLELAKNNYIRGYPDESDFWMDVGKPEELERARVLACSENPPF